MNVLIVVCDLGRGGVQRGARNFAIGFRAQGHEVLLATTRGGSGGQEIDLPVPSVGLRALLDQWELAQGHLSGFQPDMIQLHAHLLEWELVRRLVARWPDAVVVEQSIWSRWMPSTPLADLICHQSPWMAACFDARTWLRPSRPQSFTLGKPVQLRDQPKGTLLGAGFRDAYSIPRDALVLGRVGQPFSDKWHVCLIDGFRSVASQDATAHLLCIAPPSDIRAEVDRLPPDMQARVRVIDWLDDDDLDSAYAAMDVFVHAAKRGESFGFVLVEALSRGVPVVSLSTPYADNAQVDWLHLSGAGLIVDVPSHMPLALGALDKGALARLGAKGPPAVRFLSIEEQCRRLLDAVDGLPTSDARWRSPGRGPRTQIRILQGAGVPPPLSLRALLYLRPWLAWSYVSDRAWTELTRRFVSFRLDRVPPQARPEEA